jgi:ferredoxin
MTMHQLTIDTKYCRGLHLCHTCEAIRPGLVKHCEQHGRLLVSWQATGSNAATISSLIAHCPDRAITITPVEAL